MQKTKFFCKNHENIWSIQKKAVPLQPLSRKIECDGGIAQLVRAHDS
jgi:hypothetical protein